MTHANLGLSLCPACGEGKLVAQSHISEQDIDGYRFTVSGLLHSVCNHCAERFTSPDQSRHNKRTVEKARAGVVTKRDRSQRLAPAAIHAIRKKLGLTQGQAARVFGGGANAFSKYELGAVAPSIGMEKLLRLADSVPGAAAWLLWRGGVKTGFSSPTSPRVDFTSGFEQVRQEWVDVLLKTHRDLIAQNIQALHSALSDVRDSDERHFTYTALEAANDPDTQRVATLASVG